MFPVYAFEGLYFGDEAAARDEAFLVSEGFKLVVSSQPKMLEAVSTIRHLSGLAGEFISDKRICHSDPFSRACTECHCDFEGGK